jgi:hypothetical protein
MHFVHLNIVISCSGQFIPIRRAPGTHETCWPQCHVEVVKDTNLIPTRNQTEIVRPVISKWYTIHLNTQLDETTFIERCLFFIIRNRIKKFNYLQLVSNKLLLQQIQLKNFVCKRSLIHKQEQKHHI